MILQLTCPPYHLVHTPRSGDVAAQQEAEQYDFWAATFVLPAEYGMFLEEFKRHAGGRWIMKPIGKAQGRGIFLFDKLSDISDWKRDATWKSDGALAAKTADTYIVQKYVEQPYTIGGKKFDLRLYVLVTSFSPLTFWIYRAGFARFSSSRYSQRKDDIDNLCASNACSAESSVCSEAKETHDRLLCVSLNASMAQTCTSRTPRCRRQRTTTTTRAGASGRSTASRCSSSASTASQLLTTCLSRSST